MGEMDFVIKGAMIGGFALAAAPAQYRVTGVKSFMVGPDGVVYEKDLGADTLKTFEAMERYNPDKTWKATEDGWPDEEGEGEEEAAPGSQPDGILAVEVTAFCQSCVRPNERRSRGRGACRRGSG